MIKKKFLFLEVLLYCQKDSFLLKWHKYKRKKGRAVMKMKKRVVTVLTLTAVLLCSNCVWAAKETKEAKEEKLDHGTIMVYHAGQGDCLLGEQEGLLDVSSYDNWDKKLEDMKKEKTPNETILMKSIPKGAITALTVNASLCGVALEEIPGNQFTIEYVGIEDRSQFQTETKIENNELIFDIKGTAGQLYYVNVTPEYRVNTIRIGVPADTIQKINIKEGTSFTVISNIDCAIHSDTPNGILKVEAKELTWPVTADCGSGSIWLKANTISGKVNCSAENGVIEFYTPNAAGNITISAQSGNIITEILEITGHVSTKIGSGNLTIGLLKRPENLKIVLKGDKVKKGEMPTNWRDGYSMGNGKPVLEMERDTGKLVVTVKDLN